MGRKRWAVLIFVLPVVVAGVGHSVTGVSAQSLGDIDISVDAPTEATVGEEVRVSGEVTVPDVPRRDVSTDVTGQRPRVTRPGVVDSPRSFDVDEVTFEQASGAGGAGTVQTAVGDA